ncbi:MAG: tripartite tricarboxylate transporter TctB family protein [Rhodospirillales bacterium]|nr:tripartite tricarboxylate transporter TctB family protein [Rhodospirillales bacterium]
MAMRRLNADIIIAALLLAFSGILFAATFTFQSPPLFHFSIRTWPRAVAGALAVLSSIYLIQSLAHGGPERREPFIWRAWFAANRNVIICFVLFAFFLATLPIFGMLIGGIMFVYASFALIGGWNDLRTQAINAAVAVVFVGGMWAAFTFALRVILPGGIFHI